MTAEPPRYPDLRGSIAVVLEAVGYRLDHGASISKVAQGAFRCSPSGVTRRLDGEIRIDPADMSRLVQRLTVAADGIAPEHFHDGPEALRRILRERGVGLYGRSAGSRLHRAVRDFSGDRGEIQVRPGLPRAGGFVWGDAAQATGPRVLRPDQPVHFACKGPVGLRLLLLDHAPDAGDTVLLVPALAGDWPAIDDAGRAHFPGRDDPPLWVRRDTAVRQVVALWLPEATAAGIDGLVPVSETPFRPIPETALARIIACLGQGRSPDRAHAVADLVYRSADG